MIFKQESRTIYCNDNFYCGKYKNECKYCSEYVSFCMMACHFNGYLIHRDNGPAIEWNNGHEEWFLNGICYTKEEYYKILNFKSKNKVLDEI